MYNVITMKYYKANTFLLQNSKRCGKDDNSPILNCNC